MLMTILIFIVGLLGAAALTVGAWMLLPAAGWITGGVLGLTWSYMMSRSLATPVQGDN